MNVYFIDPTYIKPEGWEPLLKYLKIKKVYSFIPQEQLPTSLYSLIENDLMALYPKQDVKKFADFCTFGLRAHFEKQIRLITADYADVKSVPKEELKNYNSRSPHNNLFLDTENCLILLELYSNYDYEGHISVPECSLDTIMERHLPTHMAAYCLNILNKKYQHKQYQAQSAFVLFDKYFSSTYRYNHASREWDIYNPRFSNDKTVSFLLTIHRGVHKISPDEFPIIEKENKRYLTRIINDEGRKEYVAFMKAAKEAAERAAYYGNDDDGESWEDEVAEMNRDFWKECGAAASNCESWPGWG